MTISDSSNSTLNCRLRKEAVAATPEEKVRQQLIYVMTEELGYPPGLIAIEKELSELPHLKDEKVPKRRLDLLCYKREGEDLVPLILIECKAVAITRQVISQVTGYNRFVRAQLVAVANSQEIKTGWLEQETNSYKFVSGLPVFADLL